MSKKKKHYKIKSYTPGNNCPTKKQGYKDRKTATKRCIRLFMELVIMEDFPFEFINANAGTGILLASLKG